MQIKIYVPADEHDKCVINRGDNSKSTDFFRRYCAFKTTISQSWIYALIQEHS